MDNLFEIISYDINFHISHKTDIDSSISDIDAVPSRVENVAEFSAFRVGVVSDASIDWVVSVGEEREDIVSSKCVEDVVSVSLNLIFGPESLRSSQIDQGRDEFVVGRVTVHAAPENFSVQRVISSIEILFRAVVYNRNTSYWILKKIKFKFLI